MVKPVDPAASIPYVCAADRETDASGLALVPEAERTTWMLRVPNVADEAEIKQLGVVAAQRGLSGFHYGRSIVEILRIGLVGADNFRNPDGTVIEWKTEERTVFGRRRTVVSDAFLDRIPSGLRDELVAAITNGSGIPELDAKNS